MPGPEETSAPRAAAPPGGLPLAVAKRAAEYALWTRVALQRRWESRRGPRPLPAPLPATDLLRGRAMAGHRPGGARMIGLKRPNALVEVYRRRISVAPVDEHCHASRPRGPVICSDARNYAVEHCAGLDVQR